MARLHALQSLVGRLIQAVCPCWHSPGGLSVLALAQATDGGTLLADRAYQTKELLAQFDEQADLRLITPRNGGEEKGALISRLRERIATTFSQLQD